VQLVSVASAHSRETTSIVLSILADRIFPFARHVGFLSWISVAEGIAVCFIPAQTPDCHPCPYAALISNDLLVGSSVPFRPTIPRSWPVNASRPCEGDSHLETSRRSAIRTSSQSPQIPVPSIRAIANSGSGKSRFHFDSR